MQPLDMWINGVVSIMDSKGKQQDTGGSTVETKASEYREGDNL
jgi:hypothetical protein